MPLKRNKESENKSGTLYLFMHSCMWFLSLHSFILFNFLFSSLLFSLSFFFLNYTMEQIYFLRLLLRAQTLWMLIVLIFLRVKVCDTSVSKSVRKCNKKGGQRIMRWSSIALFSSSSSLSPLFFCIRFRFSPLDLTCFEILLFPPMFLLFHLCKGRWRARCWIRWDRGRRIQSWQGDFLFSPPEHYLCIRLIFLESLRRLRSSFSCFVFPFLLRLEIFG